MGQKQWIAQVHENNNAMENVELSPRAHYVIFISFIYTFAGASSSSAAANRMDNFNKPA